MKILLTGATGGIGSAIKEMLDGHDIVTWTRADPYPDGDDFDWLICAHGVISEGDPAETFMANTISQIFLTTVEAKGTIFISSTAAMTANSMFPVYSASKAAINTYCKAMAKNGMNCYAICPGPTDTKMWRKLGLEGKAQDPLEVAKVVNDVLEGKYNSGDIITVRNGVASV